MKKILAALVCLLALTSCGWHGVGTVVGKEYDDQDTYMTSQTQCSGNPVVCHTIYYPQTDPERYLLIIKDDAGDTHKVQVDPYSYKDAINGDYWDNSGES